MAAGIDLISAPMYDFKETQGRVEFVSKPLKRVLAQVKDEARQSSRTQLFVIGAPPTPTRRIRDRRN